MRITSSLVATLVATVVATLGGCFYANLEYEKGQYKNYPATVEAEQLRRAKRRKHALIGAPIQIAVGAGLAAAGVFGRSKSMPPDSVVDGLGDAGKELGGRILIGGVGAALLFSGLGDLVLGATDPLRSSPYLRNGAVVGSDRVDDIAPLREPRIDLHLAQNTGIAGTGGGGGLGLSHWVSDRVRLRHTASGDFRLTWHGLYQGGVTAETAAELAFERTRGGLVPKKSIGVYAGAGMWWIEEGSLDAIMGTRTAPTATGGVLFDFGDGQVRLGSRYLVGVDRLPSIDLIIQAEFGGD